MKKVIKCYAASGIDIGGGATGRGGGKGEVGREVEAGEEMGEATKGDGTEEREEESGRGRWERGREGSGMVIGGGESGKGRRKRRGREVEW